MSEQNPEVPAQDAPADNDSGNTPPWGDDFDAEKAWGLVTSLREEVGRVKADRTPQDEKDAKTIATLKRQLADAEPIVSEFRRLEEASKTETERAKDAAAAAQQRVADLTNRAVQAEVKALAANTFADPSDATAFIDPAKYVNDAGEIDTAAIESDLADLLSRKPHLGRTSDGPRPPAPNPAQGSSSTGPAAPAQLSQEDVDRLYKAKDYDAIDKARTEGRLDQLLGA